jgi:indole-3-glycerol phosphate synthase
MMQSILEQIVAEKHKEVELLPDCEFLLAQSRDLKPTKDFLNSLKRAIGPALIAEIKKASPSKGLIRADFNPVSISKDYETGGAHCLSVLTDQKYFQGALSDLSAVAQVSSLPCLRKDFIIHKKQILEARIAGADAILLIAAILDDQQISKFHNFALDLGLDVLVEVHNSVELQRVLDLMLDHEHALIGINNRNLKNFEVSLNVSIDLVNKFKNQLSKYTLVSESGISTKADIDQLHALGIKAFLIGESLMKEPDLRNAVRNLFGTTL